MRGRATWLAIALIIASCSAQGDPSGSPAGGDPPPGGSDPASGAEALVEVDGPLIGLVIGTTVDEEGVLADAGRSFEPSTPEITAVASAGMSEGEILFEWFSLEQPTDDGEPARTKLFEHQVATGPLEGAFSTGTSPGTLESGSYAVTATLGDASAIAEFEVPGDSGDGSTGGVEPSEGPPVPGDSGTVTSGFEASPAQPRARLVLYGAWGSAQPGGTIPGGPTIDLSFATDWYAIVDRGDGGDIVHSPAERGFSVEGSIGAAGGSVRQRGDHPAGAERIDRSFTLDPCRLPGGSDLPGTRLDFALAFLSGGPGEATTQPRDYATLGADETPPWITTFDTSVPDGGHVEAGDTIGFEVIARDQKREGATWQTGIARLQVRANDELIESVEGPRLPPKCDDSARLTDLQGEYEVPDDAPSAIRLCVLAEDYASNVRERCVLYRTAQAWSGSAERMRSEVIYSTGAARCEDAWRFEFTLIEADDGSLTGEGVAVLVQDWICEPAFPDARSPSQEFRYTIEGERDGDTFDLTFLHESGTAGVGMAAMWNLESASPSVTVVVEDGRGSTDARWTYSFTDPTGSVAEFLTEGTVELECLDCP